MTDVNTTETTETVLDQDQIKERKFFGHDAIADGIAYYNMLNGSVEGVEWFVDIKTNDQGEVIIPDGHGLVVIPMQKRNTTEPGPMQLTGYIVATAPEFETVIANPKGAEAIFDAYLDLVARKLRGIVNSADDGSPIIFPASVEAFFERQSRGEGLQAFIAVAKSAVKQLREQGFKKMDVNTLRNIFMSESFAAARYPKIPQSAWLAFMDKMKETAKTANLDVSIYDAWKGSRSETTLDDVDNIDLSAIGLEAATK
jgi:hypothetical protein